MMAYSRPCFVISGQSGTMLVQRGPSEVKGLIGTSLMQDAILENEMSTSFGYDPQQPRQTFKGV